MEVTFKSNAFVATLFSNRVLDERTSNIINEAIQTSMRKAIAHDIADVVLKDLADKVKKRPDGAEAQIANFIAPDVYNRVCLMLKYDEEHNVVGNAGIEELLAEVGSLVAGKLLNKGYVIYRTHYDDRGFIYVSQEI